MMAQTRTNRQKDISGQNGRRDEPDGGHGQRNLHEGVAMFVLDDDAAHVAFVDQFLDLVHKVLPVNLELLEHLAESVHW